MSTLTVSNQQREREAYRQSRARRSVLMSLASTAAFAAILWMAISNAPGWPSVKDFFFNLDVARAAWPRVAEGFLLNLKVLAVSAVSVLILALVIALLRTLRGPVFFPLRLFAATYTDVFRGLPLIISLYLIGLGLPGLRLAGVPNDPVVLGTIAIVLTYSAYVAEVFRAGIEAVHPSQRAAARAVGLTHGQTMRLVVLPQAVRRVTPPLLNDFVALQKDVGLISVLGAVDAVRAAQIESAQAFNYTPYVLAGLLFILLAVPTARIADYVSAKAARREQSGGQV